MKTVTYLCFIILIFGIFFNCDFSNYQDQENLEKIQNFSSEEVDTRAKSAIILYPNTKYKGKKVKLNNPGQYNLAALKKLKVNDNAVSSLKIKKGYEVILFDGPDFNGDSITVNKNRKKLNTFDNKTSSLILKKQVSDDDDDDDDDDNEKLRIAISADGNSNPTERADWFAVPAMYALLNKAEEKTGKIASLVHLDYNSYLCNSIPSWEKEMTDSVIRGAEFFNIQNKNRFNSQKELKMAVNNLAISINTSSIDNELHIVVAAPLEVMYQGIVKSQLLKRQYVTLYSNSRWLEKHRCAPNMRNIDDIKKTGVRIKKLSTYSTHADWSWVCELKCKCPEFGYLCSKSKKIKKSYFVEMDILYFILTGKPKPSASDYKNFLL